MIKVKVNNEYKDVVKIFCGGTLQKEITKVWSGEAQEYVYESSVEYTGSLPITITANGDALLDYRIYGASGGVGVVTENLIDASKPGVQQRVEVEPGKVYTLSKYKQLGAYGKPEYAVYDENDNLLSLDYLDSWMSASFTVPSIGKYALITFGYVYTGLVSFVKGESPTLSNYEPYPENYIPYGYKLPMTVMNNLAAPLSQWVDGFITIFGDLESASPIRREKASDFIEVKPNTQYVFGIEGDEFPSVTDSAWVAVCFYRDDRKSITRDSTTKKNPYTFLTSSETKYIRLSYRSYGELLEPRLSERSFSIPVYIGENQLDSVEGVADYVDKLSGKIVRMIGEYTFTGDESFNKYGNSDVFYTSTTIDPVGITTVNTITMRCNHPAFTAIENKDTRYWLNPEADDICCFLPGGRSQVFLRSTSNFTTATECKAYLKAQYDNGTPVKISYWLKTPIEEDPPVPFPDIPTIEGETVIDYDREPKPSQMYVKYRR